jgi:hypothetical protein
VAAFEPVVDDLVFAGVVDVALDVTVVVAVEAALAAVDEVLVVAPAAVDE